MANILNYKPIEIWSSTIHLTFKEDFAVYYEQPIKKIPLELHLKSKHFINKFIDPFAKALKVKSNLIKTKITYHKQIGEVNDTVLEEFIG
jgi:hypothetical protein